MPFLAFLTLISLTTFYLTKNLEQKKIFQFGAIALSVGIFIFAIVDRQNKDYYGNIFIDADLSENGEIVLNCKPGFADSRTFVIKTKSKELEDQIKEFGEFYKGSYFLQNTRISKNYRFTKLKSITIKQFGDNELKNHLSDMRAWIPYYYRSVPTCTKKRRKGIQNAGAALLGTGSQFVSFI